MKATSGLAFYCVILIAILSSCSTNSFVLPQAKSKQRPLKIQETISPSSSNPIQWTNKNPPIQTTTTRLEIVPSRQRLKDLEWKSPTDEEVTEWLKKYGEVSRFYRRDVFTPGDWVRSRRPTRYWANIRSTVKSGLIRQIASEVLIVAGVSAFVVLYNNVLVKGWWMWGGRKVAGLAPYLPAAELPLAPFNLAAASLGLLLTFRTNVSYQRWNEARTAWGKVINDSRSLARMGCIWGRSYNKYKTNNIMLQKLGDAICSFSRTLMNRTLPKQEDEENFKSYIFKNLSPNNPRYAQTLLHAKHRPTAALAEITSLLVQMDLHPLHQVEIEKMATELCSSMGACERILSSPVPRFYPRHTARFLAVWLLSLPMALYDCLPTLNHFGLIPVMMVLSGFMLGIEELSNQMEEPFSILPMEKMCEGSIRVPVMEQVTRSQEWNQAEYVGYPPSSMTVYDSSSHSAYNDANGRGSVGY